MGRLPHSFNIISILDGSLLINASALHSMISFVNIFDNILYQRFILWRNWLDIWNRNELWCIHIEEWIQANNQLINECINQNKRFLFPTNLLNYLVNRVLSFAVWNYISIVVSIASIVVLLMISVVWNLSRTDLKTVSCKRCSF